MTRSTLGGTGHGKAPQLPAIRAWHPSPCLSPGCFGSTAMTACSMEPNPPSAPSSTTSRRKPLFGQGEEPKGYAWSYPTPEIYTSSPCFSPLPNRVVSPLRGHITVNLLSDQWNETQRLFAFSRKKCSRAGHGSREDRAWGNGCRIKTMPLINHANKLFSFLSHVVKTETLIWCLTITWNQSLAVPNTG